MEELEAARRKVLQVSVAALCVESGFVGIEKDALGVFTEVLQTCKYQSPLFLIHMHSMTIVWCSLPQISRMWVAVQRSTLSLPHAVSLQPVMFSWH